jgi:peroxiredoxin
MSKFTQYVCIISCAALMACSSQNKEMPAFNTVDFKQQNWRSDALKGNVFVMHFWATNCVSCIEEMPLLRKSYEKLSVYPNFKMLAVNMPYDPPNYIIAYQNKEKLPFPMSFDVDGKITKAFNVQATPTTFVFNKKGERVQTIVGPISDQFEKKIIDLLNE